MQRLGRSLERLPRLYIAVQRLRSRRGGFAGHIVSQGDAGLIDAFPRSGSSFALKAFRQSNPQLARRIGTHMHSVAHVAEAVRLGVPALVLIREPAETIPSLLALGIQSGTVVPTDASEILRMTRMALDRYIDFHQALLPLADHVIIADFSQVTRDYGQVVRRMNDRFGSRFTPFDHSPEAAAAIFQSSRQHLGPSTERDAIKARLRDAYNDPVLEQRRRRAKSLYERIGTEHAL